jgi:acetyl-CoA carboxylase/biotin carboxylase 1
MYLIEGYGTMTDFVFLSRTGRMEAKGCAQSMVWKDARRRFYWAVRARLAQSTALDTLEAASPESTHEYRIKLLHSLASLGDAAGDEAIATALERLDLTDAVSRLKGDHLTTQLTELARHDRKSMVNGLVRFVEGLSDEEKIALRTALQTGPHPPSYAS